LTGNKGIAKSLYATITCPELKEYGCVDNDRIHLIDNELSNNFISWCRKKIIEVINEIEVLQNKPTDKQIELVEKYAPVASVIHEYNLDFYGLGLRGCGMDLSEYLELAYYIIDGVSPIKARSIMSLSGKAKELLEFCRDTVKKDGSVSFYEIQDFLTKDKGEEK